VDTLAMYYNRDLFNAASVAEAPATWTQFLEMVPKLTALGPNDAVVQSGAALGTSQNVDRAFDIVSLLMMQNGTIMTDDRGRAVFATEDRSTRTIPGAQAVSFYTDFANPLKEVYTWNAAQPNSLDAFVTGKTAVFFGYAYHLPTIQARAQRIRFAIAPVPQIADGRTVNYANYWIETVSKAGSHQNWAWDFVQYATSAEHVKSYLTAANKPTARRALINSQIADENLGPFVGQLLTAKSWYKGRNAEAATKAFLDLIDASLAGKDMEDEIIRAQNAVNQTL
jgi:multiple sugar transport system substrate-binding protein